MPNEKKEILNQNKEFTKEEHYNLAFLLVALSMLSPADLKCIQSICEHLAEQLSKGRTEFFPSAALIAKKAKVCRRSVHSFLKRNEDLGNLFLIRYHTDAGRSNRYKVNPSLFHIVFYLCRSNKFHFLKKDYKKWEQAVLDDPDFFKKMAQKRGFSPHGLHRAFQGFLLTINSPSFNPDIKIRIRGRNETSLFKTPNPIRGILDQFPMLQKDRDLITNLFGPKFILLAVQDLEKYRTKHTINNYAAFIISRCKYHTRKLLNQKTGGSNEFQRNMDFQRNMANEKPITPRQVPPCGDRVPGRTGPFQSVFLQDFQYRNPDTPTLPPQPEKPGIHNHPGGPGWIPTTDSKSQEYIRKI